MDYDSLLQLAFGLLSTLAVWYRNQKRTQEKIKTVEDTVQIVAQGESERICALENEMAGLKATITNLKSNKMPSTFEQISKEIELLTREFEALSDSVKMQTEANNETALELMACRNKLDVIRFLVKSQINATSNPEGTEAHP